MYLTFASEPFLAYDKFEFVEHALKKHPRADGAIPVQEREEEAAAAPEPEQNLPAADTSGYVEPAASGKSPSKGKEDWLNERIPTRPMQKLRIRFGSNHYKIHF